jgi:hypothetical protein
MEGARQGGRDAHSIQAGIAANPREELPKAHRQVDITDPALLVRRCRPLEG